MPEARGERWDTAPGSGHCWGSRAEPLCPSRAMERGRQRSRARGTPPVGKSSGTDRSAAGNPHPPPSEGADVPFTALSPALQKTNERDYLTDTSLLSQSIARGFPSKSFRLCKWLYSPTSGRCLLLLTTPFHPGFLEERAQKGHFLGRQLSGHFCRASQRLSPQTGIEPLMPGSALEKSPERPRFRWHHPGREWPAPHIHR